ncbi:MAG: hypothetical protein H7255_16915 [Ramlibacter sp.]|nr:hypothetical protein [Ramlibacter sp.]
MKGGRQGWSDYANILRSISDTPATAASLAAEFDMNRDSMGDLLRSMRALKLVHVPAMQAGRRGRPMRVYAFGDGPGVDPLTYRTRRPTVELIALSMMLRALMSHPHSGPTLAETVGVSPTRAGGFLKHLRMIGMVYVAAWDRRLGTGGKPTAKHRFGIDVPDAMRPIPLTSHENDRNDRLRKDARIRQVCRLRALAQNASIFSLAQSA